MDTYGNGHTGVLERLRERKQTDHGFSLIELIVVVIVIGIIAAIAIPVFLNAQNNARQSAVEESAHAGLTTATAALLNGEDINERLAEVSGQNDDIEVSLTRGGSNSPDSDDLCVEASYAGTDNVATAGVACSQERLTTIFVHHTFEIEDPSLAGQEYRYEISWVGRNGYTRIDPTIIGSDGVIEAQNYRTLSYRDGGFPDGVPYGSVFTLTLAGEEYTLEMPAEEASFRNRVSSAQHWEYAPIAFNTEDGLHFVE